MNRRQFLKSGTLLAAGAVVGDLGSGPQGRLTARPIRPSATIRSGLYPLGLGAGRDGLVYVPPGYDPVRPVPLLVMLHGKGGGGRISESIVALADEFRVAVLAPDSRGVTWDIIHGTAGPDVSFIDSALARTFAWCAVDARRLAIAGFSDGASYALWLGIVNGDLFGHVIAFSPGFLERGLRHGSPRIFISHGTADDVFPVDRSRHLVPQLQQAGYRVTYREFDGPHAMPPAVVRQAFEWFSSSS